MKYDLNDKTLKQLIYKKDRSAFSYLYDKYASPLFGIVCKLVKDNTLAERVLEKSFISMWQQSEKLEDYSGSLFIWMHNISRNVAIEELNRSMRLNKAEKDTVFFSERWVLNQ